MPVGELRGPGADGVDHHLAEALLGGGQAGGVRRGRQQEGGASLPLIDWSPGFDLSFMELSVVTLWSYLSW